MIPETKLQTCLKRSPSPRASSEESDKGLPRTVQSRTNGRFVMFTPPSTSKAKESLLPNSHVASRESIK